MSDGRYEHRFRQSQLTTAEMCLERARRETHPDVERPDLSGDAALYGTVLHSVIENAVKSWLSDDPWPSAEVMFDQWRAEFWPLTEDPNYEWLSLVKEQVEADAIGAVRAFKAEVQPRLYPLATELEFKDLVLYEDEKRIIFLSGIIDYVDKYLGLVDWKTSGRKYDRWEKQRWGIQPTIYTWAYNQLEWYDFAQGDMPFTYFVFLRSSKGRKASGVQELQVTRNIGDWTWMKHKALNMAKLIEGVGWDEEWPLSDGGWWCSQKWCSYWDECKGKAYSESNVTWRQ